MSRYPRWSVEGADLAPKETSIMNAVLDVLQRHPKVAFAYRSNSGAGYFRNAQQIHERFVRFGFKGQPDITGALDGGRALYLEVKTAKGKTSEHQDIFLTRAKHAGCLCGVVRSVHDLMVLLESASNPKCDGCGTNYYVEACGPDAFGTAFHCTRCGLSWAEST